jgi:hypothetical protein
LREVLLSLVHMPALLRRECRTQRDEPGRGVAVATQQVTSSAGQVWLSGAAESDDLTQALAIHLVRHVLAPEERQGQPKAMRNLPVAKI